MHRKLKAKPLGATAYEIALYITHLTNSGLKSTTIRTHLSAIAFFHKIHDCPDPTTSFIIKKLLAAGKKTESPQATHKPITAKILKRLLNSLKTQDYKNYDKIMFTSIFNVMYQAAFRASEICETPFAQHTLKASQLQISKTSKGEAIMLFYI
jgi:site-specific recombinase XerD